MDVQLRSMKHSNLGDSALLALIEWAGRRRTRGEIDGDSKADILDVASARAGGHLSETVDSVEWPQATDGVDGMGGDQLATIDVARR
ncbi:hypothetical protein ACQPZQ_15950 [Pseudonocardia sp. CA-142604]|uniref:hypothetical protein n=1 Tax=Pseudonocardia sp. CA-142604 TaxID=3240024 RepID=UPI003D8A477A